MKPEEILALIDEQNSGRDTSLVERKNKLLAQDPFTFLRGTALLFWKRLSQHDVPAGPAAWGCGDLHVQNLGTYKGSNRLTYFDINDFDEAGLLPASWEVLRMLVSLRLCGGDSRAFTSRWLQTLSQGKSFWIERETAEGPVAELLEKLKNRSRKDFLDGRTEKKGGQRTLKRDGERALEIPAENASAVKAAVEASSLAVSRPDFYKVVDVARRVAGNGSLGLDRYIILVEGKGAPDGHHLLDLKASAPSSAARFSPLKQPGWSAENERIVTLQKRLQAVPPAHLEALTLQGKPFVLKALQPGEDRVDWTRTRKEPAALKVLINDMADVTAWAALRATGRQGSASADELVAWAVQPGLLSDLEAAADWLEAVVREDWKTFESRAGAVK